MPSSDFALRWESTGDQWWYASPIDCAAANGQYDLVRELIHIDPNLLIKLSSLRRIRRLETVWDDQGHLNEGAKCRAEVAKKLLMESEVEAGHNSLIRGGYGVWLLYTAASAGDVSFVKDLLERDPFLVFGEGEYGITDVLYAAARSKKSEAFKILMESAVGMRSFGGDEGEFCDGFRSEIMNRAVHCAARGGNVELLKELLVGCGDVLGYRDAQGSTILHSAAGTGQVKVVEDLTASFDIIDSVDHQGNTALHIAAYKGFLPVVKTLVDASPSLTSSTNKQGNTFLHMAVAGFQTSGFRRLDQQLDLIRQLVNCKIINIQNIVNCRNNQGRTVLHLAVVANIQFDVVELLMTVPCIDLNIKDSDGMTPIDLLKQHPQCGSSRLLMKQMVSAGGTVSYREDPMARGPFTAHLKLQGGLGTSPGTSFMVPDSEIFLYGGKEGNDNNSEDSCSDTESVGFSSVSSGEALSQCRSCALTGPKNSMLKVLLQWPKKKKKGIRDEAPIPLRQRFSKSLSSSLENKKRASTTSAKKNFPASLMQGLLFKQSTPKSVASSSHSPSSATSRSPMPSPLSPYITKGDTMRSVTSSSQSPSSAISRSPMPSPLSPYVTKGDTMRDYTISSPYSSEKSFDVSGDGKPKLFKRSQSPFNKKSLMVNRYFCFGAQGLVV